MIMNRKILTRKRHIMKINDLVGENISPEMLQQSLENLKNLGLIDYQIQHGKSIMDDDAVITLELKDNSLSSAH